jgi:hypothetical protein
MPYGLGTTAAKMHFSSRMIVGVSRNQARGAQTFRNALPRETRESRHFALNQPSHQIRYHKNATLEL